MMAMHHDSQNAVRLENGKPSERAGRKASGLSPQENLGYGSRAAKRMEHLLYWISQAQRNPIGGHTLNKTLPRSIEAGFACRSRGRIFLFLLFLFLTIPALLFVATNAQAQVTLSWTASTSTNVTGYYIYYGTSSSSLGNSVNAGNNTTYTFSGLSPGTYYFAAVAYDASGGQSGDSNVVSYTVPAATCTYSLNPTSAQFTASGGTGSVTVTTQSGCAWTAASGALWVTIASGSTSGTGTGTVNYTVAANTTTSQQTEASTIAGLTFTVTEAAGDPSATQTYTITASAGTGGSISPSGSVTVNSGSSQTFGITPNSGYIISGVTVDGKSMGKLTSYTFNNVTANHTIKASFRRSRR